MREALPVTLEVTGKAVMSPADSGGSAGQGRASHMADTAHEAAANKPFSLNAKAATLTERELCGCGLISRVSLPQNLQLCLCRKRCHPNQVTWKAGKALARYAVELGLSNEMILSIDKSGSSFDKL